MARFSQKPDRHNQSLYAELVAGRILQFNLADDPNTWKRSWRLENGWRHHPASEMGSWTSLSRQTSEQHSRATHPRLANQRHPGGTGNLHIVLLPPPPPRWVILPPCAKGIRTSVSNRKLMPERIITAIFTAVCSNLCLAVICCYAPKQVAEKRKYKFYQYAVWNKAPTYERVVKVKAGTIEDESRNNK